MKRGLGLFVLAAVAFTVAWGQPVYAETEETPVIETGVCAGEVDLGGLTKEEAKEKLDAYYQQLAESAFTVTADGRPVETTLARLGFSWDSESVAEEAVRQGKGGSILSRYIERKDLENGEVNLTVPYTLDTKAVAAFVGVQVAALDTPPQDATIAREDGAFVVTSEINGLQTNKVETVKAVEDAVAQQLGENMTVEAIAEVTKPACTSEVLNQIQDLLGDCTTDVSGTDARYTNVKVASGNINGKVLMPGESASASTMMKKRTAANGYKKAPQYVDGRSEDAYGGGVCQVSSTLYNALLDAELQIDERHPHSMLISYLKPSKDAAIADGAKDLRFTNNTENPIYIEAYCSNRKLTFNIYGVETRPSNREVVYESHTVYRSQPADIIKYDPSQPVGYTSSTGQRHPNAKSYLEKVVYVDGQEVSRERLHTDSYSSSVKTIIQGTGGVDPNAPVDPVTPDPQPTPNPSPSPDPAPDPQPDPEPAPEPDLEPAPAPDPEPAPAPEEGGAEA